MDYLKEPEVWPKSPEPQYQIIKKYVNFKTVFSINCTKMHDLTRVINSRIAYECFIENFEEGQIEVKEFFYCMALNRHCRLLGILKVSEGGLSATVADIRIILKFLIDVQASAAVLCHNHPSGNLQPSVSDIEMTKKFASALKLCDIDLNDHLIITPEDYYSLEDHGGIKSSF